MVVPKLPLDVIAEILSFLPSVDGGPPPDPNALQEVEIYQPSSQAAALTCHEWLPLARKNIFRSCVFDPIPNLKSADSVQVVARRLPFLREITWSFKSMSTTELAIDDWALADRISRLRVLLEGNDAPHAITISLYPLESFVVMFVLLKLVPGIMQYFRKVYWHFNNSRDLSTLTTDRIGSIMKGMDSITHVHLSDFEAGGENIALMNTITSAMNVPQIVRLGLFNIQFPSGSTACSLIAAFINLGRLDIGKLIIHEPSETEPQLQKVPPLRFLKVTAPLENMIGNIIYHESYSYLFRWIASQPEQSKLEDLHFEDVFAALDYIKPSSTRNLSCFSRTASVDLSGCPTLKRLNVTSECLKGFTNSSCIQLIIPTLNSVPEDVRLISLHIKLVLPPKDEWSYLQAALDRPCFQHLTELLIIVSDSEGAAERWHELDVFAGLRGFRRMFKHHETSTGRNPDQFIINFMTQLQQ